MVLALLLLMEQVLDQVPIQGIVILPVPKDRENMVEELEVGSSQRK